VAPLEVRHARLPVSRRTHPDGQRRSLQQSRLVSLVTLTERMRTAGVGMLVSWTAMASQNAAPRMTPNELNIGVHMARQELDGGADRDGRTELAW
jgi:hypothetical protein